MEWYPGCAPETCMPLPKVPQSPKVAKSPAKLAKQVSYTVASPAKSPRQKAQVAKAPPKSPRERQVQVVEVAAKSPRQKTAGISASKLRAAHDLLMAHGAPRLAKMSHGHGTHMLDVVMPPAAAPSNLMSVQPPMDSESSFGHEPEMDDRRAREQLQARAEGAEAMTHELRAEIEAIEAELQASRAETSALQEAMHTADRRWQSDSTAATEAHAQEMAAAAEAHAQEAAAADEAHEREQLAAKEKHEKERSELIETHGKQVTNLTEAADKANSNTAEAAALAAELHREREAASEMIRLALEQTLCTVQAELAAATTELGSTRSVLAAVRTELTGSRMELHDVQGAFETERAEARSKLEKEQELVREARETGQQLTEELAGAKERIREATAAAAAEAAARRDEHGRYMEEVRRREEDKARWEASSAEQRTRWEGLVSEEVRRRESELSEHARREKDALHELTRARDEERRRHADEVQALQQQLADRAHHLKRTQEEGAQRIASIEETTAMSDRLLRDEMKRTEQRVAEAQREIQALKARAEAAAASAQTEITEARLEVRGKEELERRSTQLEDVLKTEGEIARARCETLELQLDSAHKSITILQERVAATYAERSSEINVLKEQNAVLLAEKRGIEEIARVLRGETEAMRAHAMVSEERAKELERQRDDAMATLEIEKAERHAASKGVISERRRAEGAEHKVAKLQEAALEGKRVMGEQMQASKMMQRGYEAQLGALKHDRRNQVVGYCAELAKWNPR